MNDVRPLDRRTAETYAAWFKALADGTRVQVVSLLARSGRPLTVKEIVAAVSVGQSTVSEHLRQLAAAGFDPVTIGSEADDHKAYYPGSHRIAMRVTGDRGTGRLLGLQLYGHKNAEVAKRVDIAATAIFNNMTVDAVSDLDLSYTPPLGSPWDAVQIGAQAWVRTTQQR
jgi:NADPH-dependent 2,4-dienoyl-CoA reductase/sulfur reductase-like enzyme